MSNRDSLMSKAVQSSTSASARNSSIKSLTVSVKPSAKTSWPRSRNAKLSSSAISGVSSMSSTRDKRRLLLAGSGTRQPRLFACSGLQVHDPHASAGRVVGAVVVLDHRAPSLQRAHGEGNSFEVIARVIQHFTGVPIIREDSVTGMHPQDRVKAVERGLRPYIARGSTLLSFTDDIAFLRFRSRRSWFATHRVCASASASTAEAMLTKFFASAALIK